MWGFGEGRRRILMCRPWSLRGKLKYGKSPGKKKKEIREKRKTGQTVGTE